MRRVVAFAATMYLVTVSGCGPKVEQFDEVNVSDLPAFVVKASRLQVPGLQLERAWRLKYDGEDGYQFRGYTPDGKVRKLKITTTGRVLSLD